MVGRSEKLERIPPPIPDSAEGGRCRAVVEGETPSKLEVSCPPIPVPKGTVLVADEVAVPDDVDVDVEDEDEDEAEEVEEVVGGAADIDRVPDKRGSG